MALSRIYICTTFIHLTSLHFRFLFLKRLIPRSYCWLVLEVILHCKNIESYEGICDTVQESSNPQNLKMSDSSLIWCRKVISHSTFWKWIQPQELRNYYIKVVLYDTLSIFLHKHSVMKVAKLTFLRINPYFELHQK